VRWNSKNQEKVVGERSRQREAYEGLGIPFIYCVGKEEIENTLDQVYMWSGVSGIETQELDILSDSERHLH